MNERYIASSLSRSGYGGCWGAGPDLETAKKNLRKAGGSVAKSKMMAWRFSSKLPFAPNGRAATEEEADCYVDDCGGMNWIRCRRDRRLEDGEWVDLEF